MKRPLHYSSESFRELIEAFTAKSLPKSQWTHQAHLAVGFEYARRYSAEQAMERLRKDISAYNLSTDTPNTDTDGYHDTITWFWLQMIRQFIKDRKEPLHELLDEFLQTPSSERDHILNFYSREFLFSVKARKTLVPPDLKELK